MNKVITISRQYGSGGREVGKLLADAYGIPFYDNEIITRAAKETGFAEATFKKAEDKATNSLLYSLAMGMNVFASQEVGYARAIERDGVPKEKAAEIVLKKDKSRANYYKYHSGERWDNVLNYDLAIRSDLCGVEETARCLKAYIDQM